MCSSPDGASRSPILFCLFRLDETGSVCGVPPGFLPGFLPGLLSFDWFFLMASLELFPLFLVPPAAAVSGPGHAASTERFFAGLKKQGVVGGVLGTELATPPPPGFLETRTPVLFTEDQTRQLIEWDEAFSASVAAADRKPDRELFEAYRRVLATAPAALAALEKNAMPARPGRPGRPSRPCLWQLAHWNRPAPIEGSFRNWIYPTVEYNAYPVRFGGALLPETWAMLQKLADWRPASPDAASDAASDSGSHGAYVVSTFFSDAAFLAATDMLANRLVHCGASASLAPHPSNLWRYQVRSLARSQGFLALSLRRLHLAPHLASGASSPAGGLARAVQHIRLLADQMGSIEPLGLAVEFGAQARHTLHISGLEEREPVFFPDLCEWTHLGHLAEALSEKNFTDTEIKAIFGQNTKRFFKL